jgi:ABC-type multidrug transport system ATPase subunit
LQGRLKVAVDNFSFGVASGECFGLLGPNGAGKSTTLNVLIGEELPSSGDAFVNHFNVVDHITSVFRSLGFCPQADGLLLNLTGYEHLQIFGRYVTSQYCKLHSR